ncbi:MAG: hypothetical protein PVJ01_06395 [Pseudomonadota bacterium]|jgi:uncharacterized repeat protein (TIGR01451 family)
MKRTLILAFTVLVAAVFAAGIPQAAMAAGTTADTAVNNRAVLSWNSGAVAFSTNDTASFVVDRLVTFTVSNTTAAGDTVDVLSGVTGAAPTTNVLTFSVLNASNTTLDFALSALNSGDPVTSNISIYADDGDGTFDTTTDSIAATLDDIPADSTVYVFVVGDVASNAATPQVENVDLQAQALTAVGGTVITASAGAWEATTLQTVFADITGTAAGDGDYDGVHSDRGYYRVIMPALTVTKTITAVNDSRAFNNTDPKAIPGAVVTYRLVVENTGTAAATGVTLTDTLSDNVDVTDVSNVVQSVGAAPSLNNTDPDTIIWTVGTVATASSENLTYDVTIP